MTSAKLQSMAVQTDAPDDLIAELARLMADDARTPAAPTNEQSAPVRIPGEPVVVPVPRFDFSASSNLASGRAPASPVRIPGGEPAATDAADPFNFNFDLGPSTPRPAPAAPASATPAAPAPMPAAAAPSAVSLSTPPRNPIPSVQVDETAALDQDSLADLIAAELAADIGGSRVAAPSTPDRAESVDPASEPDNFGVPPVFGLGSAQAPATPAPLPAYTAPVTDPVRDHVAKLPDPVPASDETLDPLDEIERLVGPAVRMNLATASAAPALRSLATPVVPEPEPVTATPQAPVVVAPEPALGAAPGASSVDDAILAAAAATGAHVEWVNSGAVGPETVDEVEPVMAPQRAAGFRLNRAVAGPLVAVGLLAVAGFGLYWMLGQGGATTGPAPLLVADTTDTKETPVADTAEPAPQSVVFDEISGNGSAAEEQIVSRDQADTEAVVAANSPISSSGVMADVSGTTVDPNQDGLVNRKVRTVTVRPDGTIVSGNDSLAGSTMLPVDRPDVPEVPGADFSTPDLIASATAAAETAAAAAVETLPAVATGPVAEPGSIVPIVDAAGAPVAGRSVTIPMQRPSDFSTMAAAAIATANAAPALAVQPAATPLAPVPQPTAAGATTAPSGASAYVQMASQRSEAEAQATVQAITTRYGVLFSGSSPEIHRVDLGERGIFYRVLVPAASREGAANICTNVKAAGGDCLLL
jgi:hypothetical protein